jgi:aryl-alcohol dehydrogenase-like predicted oxidoreductase
MADLERRRLGADGPEITTVGFGAWAAGGGDWAFGWGPQDDEHSVAAMRHAVEQGVSWIDTAAVYGLGHSEEVVRRALEPFSDADRPLVFSKCGMVWDEDDRQAEPGKVLHPDNVRWECESSLRRLGVDRIDLFQCHWPDETDVPVEDSWGAMQELVAEGKVRWAGVSNFDVDLLTRCAAVGPVTSLQPPFSLIRRDAAADVLPWCEANGVGVIVYSPMQAGLLSGTFTAERAAALPEDDWRKDDWNFTEGLERNLAFVERLRPLAEARGVSVGALAIAWTLAWPALSGAIVGARGPEQVDGWLPAGGLALTPAELDAIEAALDETGVGDGPRRPPGPRSSPASGAQDAPEVREGQAPEAPGWWRRVRGRWSSA